MAAKQKVASLAELLTFLIQRGVVSGRKKIELVELCELAKEVSLVFDPDGLFEDREEVNIPADWSQEMLENFLEVVTKVDVAEDNAVEYFCGFTHAALVTFSQPITGQHIESAANENRSKGKSLQFSLIESPSSSILVRGLSATVTHDNLFYYFDSPLAGATEGCVEDCHIHADYGLALVTFSSHEAASSVLASREHSPSKATTVYVEPCYDGFHRSLLRGNEQGANHPQGSGPEYPQSADHSVIHPASSPQLFAEQRNPAASKPQPFLEQRNPAGPKPQPFAERPVPADASEGWNLQNINPANSKQKSRDSESQPQWERERSSEPDRGHDDTVGNKTPSRGKGAKGKRNRRKGQGSGRGRYHPWRNLQEDDDGDIDRPRGDSGTHGRGPTGRGGGRGGGYDDFTGDTDRPGGDSGTRGRDQKWPRPSGRGEGGDYGDYTDMQKASGDRSRPWEDAGRGGRGYQWPRPSGRGRGRGQSDYHTDTQRGHSWNDPSIRGGRGGFGRGGGGGSRGRGGRQNDYYTDSQRGPPGWGRGGGGGGQNEDYTGPTGPWNDSATGGWGQGWAEPSSTSRGGRGGGQRWGGGQGQRECQDQREGQGQRGQGQRGGGGMSRPRAAEELTWGGPGRESLGVDAGQFPPPSQNSRHNSSSAKARIAPVRLDARCEPVPCLTLAAKSDQGLTTDCPTEPENDPGIERVGCKPASSQALPSGSRPALLGDHPTQPGKIKNNAGLASSVSSAAEKEVENLRREKEKQLELEKEKKKLEKVMAEKLEREKERALEKEREKLRKEMAATAQKEKEKELERERERLRREMLENEKDLGKEREKLKKAMAASATAQKEKEKEVGKERARLEREMLEKEEKHRREVEKMRKELQQVQEEKEQADKQLRNIQNREKRTLQFPPYKLRLMRDFAELQNGCEVRIHEADGTVDFCGTQDEYDNARCEFLYKLQELSEVSRLLPPVVMGILQTVSGRGYLEQLCPADCSFLLRDSSVVCVSLRPAAAENFLSTLQRNVQRKIIKVKRSMLPGLGGLKQKVEECFPLARVTMPSAGDQGAEIQVDVLNGDAELALREVKDACGRIKSDVFKLDDPLRLRAIRAWTGTHLDQVKEFIRQNQGEVRDSSTQDCLVLQYHCATDVLQAVEAKLQVLRDITVVTTVYLESEFKSFSERCLVINGLHAHTPEVFCSTLEGRLDKEGKKAVIALTLPPRMALPKLKYTEAKRPSSKPHRTPRPNTGTSQRTQRHRGNHHGNNSIRPFKATVQNSTFTVKSGDIALEKVNAIVCAVTEDMDLQKTAVGQAILKQYPQAAQGLAAMQMGQSAAGHVQRVNLGSATSLFLVVLSKQFPVANVSVLVQRILQSAVTNGIRSVAFPPLGPGRLFQFPEDKVASAMISTAHDFLLRNTAGALQEISFVIYDANLARKFREQAKETVNPRPPVPQYLQMLQPQGNFFESSDQDSDANSASSDDSADDSADDDDDDNDDDDGDVSSASAFDYEDARGPGDRDDDFSFTFSEDDEDQTFPMQYGAAASPGPTLGAMSRSGQLTARVCVQSQRDLEAVKDSLHQELRATFIHEDKVDDARTFKKLDSKVLEELKAVAVKKDVILNLQKRGGKDVVVVRGVRVGVVEVVGAIKDKLHASYASQHLREDRGEGRRSLAPPSESIQLPYYWEISKKNMFQSLEQWFRDKRKLGNLHTLSGNDSEYTEILMLVKKTFDSRFVGHGKDATNLSHGSLQVQKIERLENPELWEKYYRQRDRLKREQQGKQAGRTFLPLDKISQSSGNVKTSDLLKTGNALRRNVAYKVNEHYLFHGTKKDFIEIIVKSGLDSRVASDNAMLGRGIYGAESCLKADSYTDSKTQRTGGQKTMILMRTLLGEPFINKNKNPTKYKKPPCKGCLKELCDCGNLTPFHSVIDDAGRNFREFVVYEACMCYPEYFITYQRV